MSDLPKNTFFDINKFPKGYGIVFMPISISRMDHGAGQTPQECIEYIEYFSPNKIVEPKVGLNMVYSDALYLNSVTPAAELKEKHMSMILRHKTGFQNLLKKRWEKFQIEQAFSFQVWNQLCLDYHGASFEDDFLKFRKCYESDPVFKKLLEEDAAFCKRELTPEQEMFFLEEFFIAYMVTHRQISLPNEYVQGREQWVLFVYPGVPLKGMVYTYQKDMLDLESSNPYKSHVYDLQAKKLIDYSRIDIDTYNYRYEN